MVGKRCARGSLLVVLPVLLLSGCPLFNTPPAVEIADGDRTVANGQTTSFTAVVTDPDRGKPSLQWYLDGAAQVGATGTTFEVTKSPAQTRSYVVKVVADDGWATAEDQVVLTVNGPAVPPPLSVTIVEGDVTVANGEAASFSTELVNPGGGEVSYRWLLDGAVLAGETAAELTLSLAPPSKRVYEVTVEASITGASAEDSETLTVWAPLTVAIAGGGVTAANGESVELVAVPSETDKLLSYQWYVDDAAQGGATSAALSFARAPDVQTVYELRVSAAAGLETAEDSVSVTVRAPELLPIRHVGSTGDFTYTLNLGAETRDVYFVLTNTLNADAAVPTGVTPLFSATPAPRPSLRPSAAAPPSGKTPPRILMDRPGTEQVDFTLSDRLRRTVLPRRALVRPAPRMDAVGGTRSFMDDSSTALIPATCRTVVSGVTVAGGGTRTLNVWVADDCWTDGGTKANLVTQDMVDALAGRFLLAGLDNDVYDWVTGVYGPEWGAHVYPDDLVPMDNQISILLYDIGYDNSTTGGVVGYFWAKDNYLNAAPPYDYSNERIMFYLDAVLLAQLESGEGTWDLADFWPQVMVSTLAHEFQHMVHFYQKSVLLTEGYPTDTWIEEMLSTATEDLVADRIQVDGPRGVLWSDGTAGSAGNPYGRLPLYAYYDDAPLTTWLSGEAVYVSYAHAYAFGAYLMRNLGGAELLRRIMHNAQTTEAAVVQAVTEMGSSRTFGELLAMWGAAGVLSDTAPGPELYRFNAGASFQSSLGGTTYQYGSIDLYNYRYYETESVWHDGLYFYSSTDLLPSGGYFQYASCNAFYLAGLGLTGTTSWEMSLPPGVTLTVVLK